MVSAGEVKVHITGDMRDLDVALRQAQGATSRAANRMGASFASLGRSVANVGALIVTAIAAGVAMSVREAAGAEEIRSKFNAVFRGSADDVRDWAETTADAASRSSIALEQYLSTFQDTFVPLGFAREEAAQFSQTLTQLSLDLASFNNESEPDTVRALQSALVGNHETVRRYGVIIDQAALNSELLNMGIRGGTDAATAQQMAMARLNIIMAGTVDAQGDVFRTADSATNQYRELQAEIRDAAVAIGQSFMPAAKVMMKWAQDIVPYVQAVGVALGNAFDSFGRTFAEDQFNPETAGAIEAEITAIERALESYWETIERNQRRSVNLGELNSFLGADFVDELGNTFRDSRGIADVTSIGAQLETVSGLNERLAELRAQLAGLTETQDNNTGSTDANTASRAAATAELNDYLDGLSRTVEAERRQLAEQTNLQNKIKQAAPMLRAREELQAASEAFSRFTIDSERAAYSVTEAIGSAFDNMARGIKVTFNDLASEIMSIMARIAFNNLIAQPVANFTQGLFDGALGSVLGTASGAAVTSAASRAGAQPAGQTIINIDAKYATEGTAQMIARAFQQNAPALVQQSVSASVEAVTQQSGMRSAI
jgi:hypothetical protein